MLEQVEEIVDLIEDGFIAYLHRDSGEVYAVRDPNHHQYASHDPEPEEEDILDMVEEEPEAFIEIRPLGSAGDKRLMLTYAQEETSGKLQERLIEALKSRHPFRHFREILEYSEATDAWLAYRMAYVELYVEDLLVKAE